MARIAEALSPYDGAKPKWSLGSLPAKRHFQYSKSIPDNYERSRGMLEKYLRRKSVLEHTGLSQSLLYEMMGRGEFPRPVKIGKRAVAWRQTDIANWQAQRENDAA